MSIKESRFFYGYLNQGGQVEEAPAELCNCNYCRWYCGDEALNGERHGAVNDDRELEALTSSAT